MIIIFLLYLCMASTFTIGKLAMAYVHPFFLITVRMIAAGLLLLGLQYWREGLLPVPRVHWGLFLQLAFFHIYCAFLPEFWALQYVSGAYACLIYSLSPFCTALLNYYFFTTVISRAQFCGLLIGFFGFIPMIYGSLEPQAIFSLPQIALLFSVCCASYGWLLLRRLSVDLGYTLPFANGLGMLLGGVFAGVTTLLVPNGFALRQVQSSGLHSGLSAIVGASTASIALFMWYTMLLIVIANIIFYNVYGYLLSRYCATFLSLAGFTTPLFAALLDWLFWGIIPPYYFFITFCMVSIGIFIFYYDELVRKK